jgi:membrane-bound metal-dependent hydrolase YbcI (DUF457 family)
MTSFLATQVIIDMESGYHLFRGDWPIHREAHSLLISGLLGLATGALVWLLARHRILPSYSVVRSEVACTAALYGGLAGGLTHPILDAVMHPDLRPFWPLSRANPFLDAIGLVALHLGCVVSGLMGAGILMFRYHYATTPG